MWGREVTEIMIFGLGGTTTKKTLENFTLSGCGNTALQLPSPFLVPCNDQVFKTSDQQKCFHSEKLIKILKNKNTTIKC